jgi:hypothetical protein
MTGNQAYYQRGESFAQTDGASFRLIEFRHAITIAGHDPEITVQTTHANQRLQLKQQTTTAVYHRRNGQWHANHEPASVELSAWLDAQLNEGTQ